MTTCCLISQCNMLSPIEIVSVTNSLVTPKLQSGVKLQRKRALQSPLVRSLGRQGIPKKTFIRGREEIRGLEDGIDDDSVVDTSNSNMDEIHLETNILEKNSESTERDSEEGGMNLEDIFDLQHAKEDNSFDENECLENICDVAFSSDMKAYVDHTKNSTESTSEDDYSTLDGLLQFIEEHDISTFPSTVQISNSLLEDSYVVNEASVNDSDSTEPVYTSANSNNSTTNSQIHPARLESSSCDIYDHSEVYFNNPAEKVEEDTNNKKEKVKLKRKRNTKSIQQSKVKMTKTVKSSKNPKKRKSSTPATDVSYQDLHVNKLNLPEEISDTKKKIKISESPIKRLQNDNITKYTKCKAKKLDNPLQSMTLKENRNKNFSKDSSNTASIDESRVLNKGKVYTVTCKNIEGKLYMDKFISGCAGECILYNGSFVTPGKFEILGGCKSSRKYKQSLRVFGKPLENLLLDNGIESKTRQRKKFISDKEIKRNDTETKDKISNSRYNLNEKEKINSTVKATAKIKKEEEEALNSCFNPTVNIKNLHIMDQDGDGRNETTSNVANEHEGKSSNGTRLDRDSKSYQSSASDVLEHFIEDQILNTGKVKDSQEPFVIDTDLNKDTDEEIIEKIFEKAEQRRKSLHSTFQMANVDGVADSNSDTGSCSNYYQEELSATQENDQYSSRTSYTLIQHEKGNAMTTDYDLEQTAVDNNQEHLELNMTKSNETLTNSDNIYDNYDAENCKMLDNDEEQTIFDMTADKTKTKKRVFVTDHEQEATLVKTSMTLEQVQLGQIVIDNQTKGQTAIITDNRLVLPQSTMTDNGQRNEADNVMKNKTKGQTQSTRNCTDVGQGQNESMGEKHLHLKDIRNLLTAKAKRLYKIPRVKMGKKNGLKVKVFRKFTNIRDTSAKFRVAAVDQIDAIAYKPTTQQDAINNDTSLFQSGYIKTKLTPFKKEFSGAVGSRRDEKESAICEKIPAYSAYSTHIPRTLPSAAPITKRRLEVPTYIPTELPTYFPTELQTYTPTEMLTYTPKELQFYAQTELPTYAPTELPASSLQIQFGVDDVISNQFLSSQSAHDPHFEESAYSKSINSGNSLHLEAECQFIDTRVNCMGPIEVSSYIEVQTTNNNSSLDTSGADINEILNINAEIEDLVTGRSEFGCNIVDTGATKGAKESSEAIFDDSGISVGSCLIEPCSQGQDESLMQELSSADSSYIPEINADYSYCPKVSLPRTSTISQQEQGYAVQPSLNMYEQLPMAGFVEAEKKKAEEKKLSVSSDINVVQQIERSEEGSKIIDNLCTIELMEFDVAETSIDALMQRYDISREDFILDLRLQKKYFNRLWQQH